MERGWRSAGRDFIRHIPVRILIEGKDKRIQPGLSASADVKVSMEQQGFLVPREALRYEAPQQAADSCVSWKEASTGSTMSRCMGSAIRWHGSDPASSRASKCC